MPHIIRPFIKYKKTLKERLDDGEEIVFADPSIYVPRHYNSRTMKPGESLICTNHPKRSWFAHVERTEKGFKVT